MTMSKNRIEQEKPWIKCPTCLGYHIIQNDPRLIDKRRDRIIERLLDRYEQVLYDMDDEKLEEEYKEMFLAEGMRD